MRGKYLVGIWLLLPLLLPAQNGFRKYEVGATGVSLYFPADPGPFALHLGEDSSEVYTGSAITPDSLEWGLILVRLKNPVEDHNKSALLKTYLDYLKEAFDILAASGYAEGHTLASSPGTIGIIDYWEDRDQNIWELKGWINADYICVTYVTGRKDIEKSFTATRFFFNGVIFP